MVWYVEGGRGVGDFSCVVMVREVMVVEEVCCGKSLVDGAFVVIVERFIGHSESRSDSWLRL